MTKAAPKFVQEKRGWSIAETAYYIGVSENWFRTHPEELAAAGFPKPDALTGNYDGHAVKHWYDLRSKLVKPSTPAGGGWEAGLDALAESMHHPPH